MSSAQLPVAHTTRNDYLTISCGGKWSPRSALWGLAAVVALVAPGGPVFGQSATWIGAAANGLWTSSGNWASGIAPAPTTPTNYVMTGTTRLSSTNSAGARAASSLTFQAGAGPFVINGGGFGLAGALTNDSSSMQTINSGIILNASQPLNTGAATTILGGVVSGAGAFNVGGSGVAVFNRPNTFSGTMTVGSGATVTGTGVIPRIVVGAGATITPGNGTAGSYGVLSTGGSSIADGFVVASGTAATVAIGIAGADRGTSYDAFNLNGTGSQFGGTLALTFDNNTLYPLGTTFNLFNAASAVSGDFGGVTVAGGKYAGLTFSGPVNDEWISTTNADGQFLSFSETTGQLVVVPEPSAGLVALLGVGLVGWHRVRRRTTVVASRPTA